MDKLTKFEKSVLVAALENFLDDIRDEEDDDIYFDGRTFSEIKSTTNKLISKLEKRK